MQIRKNQKVIKSVNDQLVVKNYPKNEQRTQQHSKLKPPNCPSRKKISGKNLIMDIIVKIVNIFLTNKNIRFIKRFVDKINILQLDCLMPIKK